jgi:hypothetical protein
VTTLDTFRKTSQLLAPDSHTPLAGVFNIYPAYPLESGLIESGFAALAGRIAAHQRVVIDGMGGVLWADFRARLSHALRELGVAFDWIDASKALLPEAEVERLIAPFLGGEDPLFGRSITGSLRDFFSLERLTDLAHRAAAAGGRTLVYGTGAALVRTQGFLVYVDVPKNEIQFRSRAGSITNLGAIRPSDPKPMYKRF